MTRRQRNIALVLIAAGLFAVAGYISFGGLTRGTPKLPHEHVSYCVSLATGKDVVVHHRLDETPPYRCPDTGQLAVYPWLYCRICRLRFVPHLARNETTGRLELPPNPTCPNCGGSNFTAYVPGMPGQQPVGDAKLPEWKP